VLGECDRLPRCEAKTGCIAIQNSSTVRALTYRLQFITSQNGTIVFAGIYSNNVQCIECIVYSIDSQHLHYFREAYATKYSVLQMVECVNHKNSLQFDKS